MARFYGVVQGSRGEASRCGDRSMVAVADGAKIGAKIFCGYWDDGTDFARVSVTDGRSGAGRECTLGVFSAADMDVLTAPAQDIGSTICAYLHDMAGAQVFVPFSVWAKGQKK
jgi:hypothetical protein